MSSLLSSYGIWPDQIEATDRMVQRVIRQRKSIGL